MLPNSPNVIMAAERAAELSDKQVLVAPTTSQQAGLAAAVALAPDRSVEENAQALTRGARARAHRRRRAGRPRRRPGALQARRGRRLRARTRCSPGASRARRCRPCSRRSRDGADGAGAPELISVLAGEDAPLGARRGRGHGQRRGRARAAPRRPGRLLVAARRRVAPPSAYDRRDAIMMAADGRDRDRHARRSDALDRGLSVRGGARAFASARALEPRAS